MFRPIGRFGIYYRDSTALGGEIVTADPGWFGKGDGQKEFNVSDTIGVFDFIRERVVDENGHSHGGFVDIEFPSFEEGLFVVEAGVNFLDGAKDRAMEGERGR